MGDDMRSDHVASVRATGWLLGIGLTSACVGVSGGKPPDDSGSVTTSVEGGIVVTNVSGTSNRQGYLKVPVHIDEPQSVVQVVGQRSGWTSIDYITDSRGNSVFNWEDWSYSDESLTDCYYMSKNTTTINWPVREVDAWMEPGDYEVWVAALTSEGRYSADIEMRATVLVRPDANLTRGTLSALIAYANGVADDPEVVAATEEAAAHWAEIYASIGITLDVEYGSVDIDAELPSSSVGDPAYEALGESMGDRKVILVVGETITGDSWLYGEAGGIPGPFAPANTGIVAVGWLANAGADGRFSDQDLLLYGETMAHEMGHYLGLYHPVEDGFEYFDALSDTQRCTSYSSCESALGSNLMFPYPVCAGRTCTRQEDVTAEQSGVAHRYVGVL